MIKTVNGVKPQILSALESFVRSEVTDEKPTMNHLFMVIEHCCSALLDRDSNYTIQFEIDLDTGIISFKKV